MVDDHEHGNDKGGECEKESMGWFETLKRGASERGHGQRRGSG